MYKVTLDYRVEKSIRRYSKTDRARIDRIRLLYEEGGFTLPDRYLRKITDEIWEFRAGRIRLLFGLVEGEAVILNTFVKKTRKTPKREIELADRRYREYI